MLQATDSIQQCTQAGSRDVQKEEEAMYGHAGMLGAAAAVWEDLRTNHFLAALLDLPADEDCKPFHQDRGEQKYDSRMSHSEKDRHMAWESGNASVSDEASGEGSPAKDAANAGKHRSQGRPKFMERRKQSLALVVKLNLSRQQAHMLHFDLQQLLLSMWTSMAC